MPNKNFNNVHKSPPSTKRPDNAMYENTSERQAMYPASTSNTDAIQNPGAKGSGMQSYGTTPPDKSHKMPTTSHKGSPTKY